MHRRRNEGTLAGTGPGRIPLLACLALAACGSRASRATDRGAPATGGVDDASAAGYDGAAHPALDGAAEDMSDAPKVGSPSSYLPVLPNGHRLVVAIPGAQLELDENLRDAITGLGRCTAWIVACVTPGGGALDACTQSAPLCSSDRPWEGDTPCCPAACASAYQTARAAGSDGLAAFRATYLRPPTCFPGVSALLPDGGQR